VISIETLGDLKQHGMTLIGNCAGPNCGHGRPLDIEAFREGLAVERPWGGIPVAGSLKAKLGLETIFMGFGLDDDRVHSPNEKFELECLRMGTMSHAYLVDELLRM